MTRACDLHRAATHRAPREELPFLTTSTAGWLARKGDPAEPYNLPFGGEIMLGVVKSTVRVNCAPNPICTHRRLPRQGVGAID